MYIYGLTVNTPQTSAYCPTASWKYTYMYMQVTPSSSQLIVQGHAGTTGR